MEDEAHHVFGLLGVHARGGLVEEEQHGVERQRPGQLHALLQAVGQRADDLVANILKLQEIDDLALDRGAVGLLLARRPAVVETARQHAGAQMHVAADLHVVEHAHAAEERDVLEGAGDPELGPLVRSAAPLMSRPSNEDPPAGGRVDPADAVEDAGLARAVGADDGEELAALDLEAHPGQGGHAAEAQVQVLQSEKSHTLVHPLVIEI